MPVVKHVLNFSELISEAARERKRRQQQHHQQNRLLYSTLKTTAIHYETETERALGREREREKDEKQRKKEEQTEKERDHERHEREREDREDERFSSLPLASYARKFLLFSCFLEQILSSMLWNLLKALIYLIASILISFETRTTISHHSFHQIQMFNYLIDCFFLCDGTIKIFILSSQFLFPQVCSYPSSILFFTGIIEISTTIGSLILGLTQIGSWFRLVRVFLISLNSVRHAAHLDVLMSGITLGIRSLLSTWLLISLVFAVYAACCMHFFGRNDPFHFGSMAMSLWTLFEMCTLDNWEKVLYINMYGCRNSPYYYSDWNYTPFNATTNVAVHQYGYLLLPICRNSEAYPALSVVIFISFTLICAFILMSIMIAVVTAGIRERIEEIQLATNQSDPSTNHLLENSSEKQKTGQLNSTNSKKFVEEKKESMSRESSGKDVFDEQQSFLQSFDPEIVLLTLKQVWKNAAKNAKKHNSKAKSLSTPVSPSGRQFVSSQFSSTVYWRAFSEKNSFKVQSLALKNITNHILYRLLFVVMILLAAMFEIIVLQRTRDQEQDNSDSSSLEWIEWLQYIFQAYFMIDLACRIQAHYPDQNAFFVDLWNRFDLALVLLTLLPILAYGTPARDVLGLLRVGRILRVLRLITWVETLNIILRAISNSMKALLFVVILMCIFFYNYAIMGVFLFRENDKFHFGTLPKSFVTLFQVSTMSSWVDIARTNMYGCDMYGYHTGVDEYDELCDQSQGLGWVAAWYFIVFILIGVMVLVSLFTGVIITSMDLLRDTSKAEKDIISKAKIMQELFYYDDQAFDRLLEIFEMIDIDHNGLLSIRELKPLLEMIIPEELDRINLFLKADANEDGQLNFAEFFLVVNDLQKYYLAHRDLADRKAQEASEARENILRSQHGSSLLNIIKSGFFAMSGLELVPGVDDSSTHSDLEVGKGTPVSIPLGFLGSKNDEVIKKLQQNQSLDSDDEVVEVIDESNIEDQVREFHVSEKETKIAKVGPGPLVVKNKGNALRIESFPDVRSNNTML